jgi:chitin disaccharide deacetylase
MIGGPAAADAVRRAHLLPDLRVGLHLVLADGPSVLPREQIPALVDAGGRFRNRMLIDGVRFFALPAVRAQLEAEIRAQFQAFAATGLRLDHVNAHKHFHLHPTVASEIITIGRRYGIRGLRVPLEPNYVLTEVEPSASRRRAYLTAPWATILSRRARRAGLQVPDSVFGLAWSGAMIESRVIGLLLHLSDGCTEIYAHPATSNGFAGHAPGYRYTDELEALTAPSVIAAARSRDIVLGGYSDF